jgi:hypothetical protein
MVANLMPLFVPEITDATSTAHFQERYHFLERVEDDIREDIRDYKQASKRRSRPVVPESVSETQLIDAAARTMRHRRSSSLAPVGLSPAELLSDHWGFVSWDDRGD